MVIRQGTRASSPRPHHARWPPIHLVRYDDRPGQAVRRAETRPTLPKPVGRSRAAALVLAVAEVHGPRPSVGATEPLPRLPRPAEGGLLPAGLGGHVLAKATLVVNLPFLLVSSAAGGG